MKVCSRCKISKPNTDYVKCRSKSDGLQSYCRECKNALSIAFRAKVRIALHRYIEENGCCNCGENDPCVIDFHHIDPKSKDVGVSKLLIRHNIKRIIAEIAKCALLCSNCHRKFHAGKLDIKFVPCDISPILESSNW